MRRRVLIVEDDPQTAGLLKTHLMPTYDAVICVTLGEAKRRLSEARNGESFDMVVYDLTLPDTRGREAGGLAELLASTSARVIIFTGSDDLQLLRECLRQGADAVLRKPVERLDVQLRLMETINRGSGVGRSVSRAMDKAVDSAIAAWPRRDQ